MIGAMLEAAPVRLERETENANTVRWSLNLTIAFEKANLIEMFKVIFKTYPLQYADRIPRVCVSDLCAVLP